MVNSQGFIKSLEAVISSALLLIFVFGIFPNLIPESKIDNTSFILINALKSSDTPEFRLNLMNENLSSIKEGLNEKIRPLEINLGILKLNSTSNLISSNQSIEFDLDKPNSEKEILFLWIENASALTIKINNHTIFSSESLEKHYKEFDLSPYTKNGANKLNFNGSGLKLNYILDLYYYYVKIPKKNEVLGFNYFISGNYSKLKPRVLVLLG